LVINFVVPWGNLMTYHFRPDGSPDGQPYPINEYEQTPADRLLVNFLSRADDVSIARNLIITETIVLEGLIIIIISSSLQIFHSIIETPS